MQGRFVTFPHVQGYVVTAYGLRIVADVFVQCRTDVFAPCFFIHADVINIQGLDVLEQLIVLYLSNLTESMAQHLPVVIDKDGLAVVVEQNFKLLLIILGGVGFE